jgi:hypothetical protein
MNLPNIFYVPIEILDPGHAAARPSESFERVLVEKSAYDALAENLKKAEAERDENMRQRVLLYAKLAEAKAALEYYALHYNWVSDEDGLFSEIRNDDWETEGIITTGGKRARAVLAKWGDRGA